MLLLLTINQIYGKQCLGAVQTTDSFQDNFAHVYLFSKKWATHGPLARYVKLQFAHVPGMPGTFSTPPRVSDPDMDHGTCVTHVTWCMPGSLTSSLFWIRRRGKRSRRMRNPQFYVSGKRPMKLPSVSMIDNIFVSFTQKTCIYKSGLNAEIPSAA